MPRAIAQRTDALPALAEVFREHGYDGASLALLSAATGLGKGSLYNFFPRGKQEMMAAVLADIGRWFEDAVFAPLERASDPAAAVDGMFGAVADYFRSGQRVCLVGSLGLGASGDAFARAISGYFARWIASLATCLQQGGLAEREARLLSEDAVAGIQGAIVLSRALGDGQAFHRVLERHRTRLHGAIGG